MTPIYISITIFLLLGLWLTIKGLRRLWQRRLVRGGMQGLSGLVFLSLAALMMAIAMNLYTYNVFTDEQVIAEVRLEELAPQYYRLYLIPEDHQAQTFEVRGDEWQIDARVIKWHGLANLLGMRTVYRLERISGRYRDVNQERVDVRSVYALSGLDGMDVWSLSRKHKRYLPWVDAIYGSSAYVPMANQAQYAVAVGNSGLLIRPRNGKAQQAIEGWR